MVYVRLPLSPTMPTSPTPLQVDANRERISITGTNVSVVAKASGITATVNGKKSDFKSDEILEFSSNLTGNGYSLNVFTNDGEIRLLLSNSEKELLIGMESMAALFEVRLEEHTGRSVEADEHGMSVIEQIETFPERWPERGADDMHMLDIKRIGRITAFTIPSALEKKPLWIFIVACLIALPIGLNFATGFDSAILNVGAAFLPMSVVVAFGLLLAMQYNLLVSKHTIALGGSAVHVRPRYLGLFGLPSREFPIEEFKDLDASGGGQLTFMFGDERITCEMDDELQADWILAEIVDALGGTDFAVSRAFEAE
jgi:hypothetical protein